MCPAAAVPEDVVLMCGNLGTVPMVVPGTLYFFSCRVPSVWNPLLREGWSGFSLQGGMEWPLFVLPESQEEARNEDVHMSLL